MRKQASKADADRTEEVNTPDKKWEAYMSLASLADVKRVLRIMATTAARLQGNAGG
jgi:hypothetical protein